MRFTICLAALAATAVSASPAFAQATAVTDSDTALARGVVLEAHQLVKDTDLDFGLISGDPALAGTVSIAATAAGARSATGGVTPLPSRYQAAKFDGLAAPLETVVLSLTPPAGNVLIDGAGNTVSVDSLDLDAGGTTRTTDTNGNFTVYVGGTFGIAAAQPAGVYSAQFTLTAEYQ